MRVLFINRMASIERGGGETFDLEVSRHLEKLGCEVSYLSGLPLFSEAKTPIDHPHSHTVRSPYFGWFPWDVVRGGWRLRVADFQVFENRAFRWAMQHRGEFDLLQVCELPRLAARWSQEGDCPVVMRLTAPNFIDPLGGLQKADRVIASGMSMEAVRSGARPDCVDIPNSVDTRRFCPYVSDFRATHGIPEEDDVLLYVARFQAFKNHAMLIDAFRVVLEARPSSRLLLAGSGPLRERVAQRCVDLGVDDRVVFLGEVPFENLPGVYAAADVKVISSDYESFCFAALEAMSTGLPVVTTDCGWVPNLVGHGEGGIITPVGESQPFAEAIIRLLEESDLRDRMADWNRTTAVAKHGWAASAEKLQALYEELL